MSGDAASALARHVGERLGLEGGRVRVEAAGRDGEIAVLVIPAEALSALLRDEVRREVAERARAAGYDHAAVDLALDAAADAADGPADGERQEAAP
ncbi:MAG TPA: hypothetical protein VKB18_08240 [Gemmatimonadota bacterium]|nr:hypothetical protein [Gemmatimonadota bacterium]